MDPMKHTLVSAAAIAALAAPAVAQAPLGPDDIPAGVYVIDSKEALVRYGTVHLGFTEFWGTFPGATGTLTIDPKAIGATRLDVTVPVASIETTNRELNGEFLSEAFFAADKYPVMRFVSTGVTRTGARTAKVAGNLTIHGVTKPVVLDVTFNAAGPNPLKKKVLTLGFKGEGVVKRSEFGLGKYVPFVSDETTITISAPFERQ
ncbi:YceI family protein [Phenylobacterium sp.]|jgi:polyisoprenoid-binding protein YceI|uniref:YceI family protein n=1 Tax=Phenylobacterium sp. TaxID=1871053 RepID=UPI002E34CCA6|nr:YceI family protein [Phenylobacterium sp.]HEX4711371.1 YceI family protein [Phenylobacterium sp.]